MARSIPHPGPLPSGEGENSQNSVANFGKINSRMKSYPKLEVKAVRNGKGIVASSRISAGERLCRIDGKIVSSRQVLRYWDRTPQRGANCFRYGPDHYVDPDGEIGQYANHSCAPNAGIT